MRGNTTDTDSDSATANTGTDTTDSDTPNRTVNIKQLMAYLLTEHPRSRNFQREILDAVTNAGTGKPRKLQSFEQKYGFKYVGKIGNEQRFILI